MKRPQWASYSIALALSVAGLLWAGVPAPMLLFVGLVLVCPLMMFVMMRDRHGQPPQQHHDETMRRVPLLRKHFRRSIPDGETGETHRRWLS